MHNIDIFPPSDRLCFPLGMISLVTFFYFVCHLQCVGYIVWWIPVMVGSAVVSLVQGAETCRGTLDRIPEFRCLVNVQ